MIDEEEKIEEEIEEAVGEGKDAAEAVVAAEADKERESTDEPEGDIGISLGTAATASAEVRRAKIGVLGRECATDKTGGRIKAAGSKKANARANPDICSPRYTFK
jgi:hypothetical protein